MLPAQELDHAYGTLPRRELGRLEVVSGRVVACDALTMLAAEAFVQRVPVGRHPVVLLGNDQTLYAAAALICAPGCPARWELAVTAGDGDPDLLAPDEVYGYPVGAGMGCFLDERALPLWQAESAGYEGMQYDRLIGAHLVDLPERDWASYVIGSRHSAAHPVSVANPERLNIVLFRSGFGDGVYGTYAGLDADGELLCLLTDFALT
jgi:hypothetical protein